MNFNLPDIYLFNPTCEYAVANGHPSWQPNLLLQKMEEDLGTLPLFFAKPGDVLLVKKLPSIQYLENLRQTIVHIPDIQKTDSLVKASEFIRTPKNWLLPWGWSPAAHRLLKDLKPSCSIHFRSSPVAGWKTEHKDFYSRKFSLEILKNLLLLLPDQVVIHPDMVPQICTTRHDFEISLARWHQLMVKAPWSSSGRGLQRITKTPVAPKVWEKLMGVINEQGYAVAEPYLKKEVDMALQFQLINKKVRYIGISRFYTDDKGQYQGNSLNTWNKSVSKEAEDFAEKMIPVLTPQLIKVIEGSNLVNYFEGYFGVDTLIFRDMFGNLRINPCLEMNVRYNMGLLAIQLEKMLFPGIKGDFKIFFKKGSTFSSFAKLMSEKYPLKLSGNKIVSGFFPLTPFDEDSIFGAYILTVQ